MRNQHYHGTVYRCIHCGGETGNTMAGAEESARLFHGKGKCVSFCDYCNKGIRHSRDVCANVPRDTDE